LGYTVVMIYVRASSVT